MVIVNVTVFGNEVLTTFFGITKDIDTFEITLRYARRLKFSKKTAEMLESPQDGGKQPNRVSSVPT